MKKILALAALFTASLAVSASAATVVGFEAGYLTDSKEAYYATRLGFVLKADTAVSHQLEVEIGYSQQSETMAPLGNPVTAKFKIVPLTLNYRAEFLGTSKLGYYVGGGVGMCRNTIKVAGSGVGSISDSDSALAYQVFVGMNYKATDTTSLHLGVKYLWIGEATLIGIKDDVGDDVAIMAGVSFRF